MRLSIGIAGIVAVIAAVVFAVMFYAARYRVEKEWGEKFPSNPRTPVEVQSLLGSLVERPGNGSVPAFIPQSMWDNERCASGVIQAVNFTLGEKKLEVVAAWKFGQENADAVRMILDRSNEFSAQKGKIVELEPFDGDFSVLDPSRLYVAGYHFKLSRMDPHIISAGSGLNSHLVLVFSHKNEWYGYHFFHAGGKKTGNDPFRVEKLEDISSLGFNLVYIWEVNSFQMDQKDLGGTAVYTHYRPQFKEAYGWLGAFGNGRIGYYADTITAHLSGWGEQFPRVGDSDGLVVLVPPGVKGDPGQVLGFYRGVEIRQHPRGEDEPERSEYGQRWQCVEFINRFYAIVRGHRNLQRTGNADSYFFEASEKGLMAFPNGSPVKPALGDILVFDRDKRVSRSPGHVAIVTQVTDDEICVVQQNTREWRQCLPAVQLAGGNWWIKELLEGLPCVGWARR